MEYEQTPQGLQALIPGVKPKENIGEQEQKRLSDRIDSLPKWAQEYIKFLEQEVRNRRNM